MGTSFTEFAGYGFWARDDDVAVWLCFLVRQIDKENDGADWKQELRQQFLDSGTAYPPGCVYTGLDKFIDNNEKREWLISLSEDVLQELDVLGGTISIAQLKALHQLEGSHGVPVWYNQPVSTTFYRDYGRKWLRLLEGRFDLKSDPEWNDIVVHDHDFNRQRR